MRYGLVITYSSLFLIRQQAPAGDKRGKQKAMAAGEPQRPAATSREALKWLPPLGEALKINVDGAFINHSGEAAAGVVVRNSKGEVLLSASRRLINCRDAEHAEALACLEGARLAQRWRMANLFLEADCST
ncbi:unnamed protein product, partial [Urochloa humidicola]